MANSCCGKWDPTETDNELVWKAIEYAEVKIEIFKILSEFLWYSFRRVD